jgi:hypothetical protein
MKGIYRNVINCCTGFIANCGEMYCATKVVRDCVKLFPYIILLYKHFRRMILFLLHRLQYLVPYKIHLS